MSLLNPRIIRAFSKLMSSFSLQSEPIITDSLSMNFLEPSRNKTCNSSISYLKPKSNLFWQVNNVEALDILFTCPFWQRGGRKKWEFFLIFLETAKFLISFGNSKDFCFWKLYHEENAHWLKLNLYFFLFVLEYATENHGETCVVSETCRWNM